MLQKSLSGKRLDFLFVVLSVFALINCAHADDPCPVQILSGTQSSTVSVASTANCAVTISSGATLSPSGIAISAGGTGSTVVNDGTITGYIGLRNSSPGISNFTNSSTGVITTSNVSIWISNSTITTFNNSGSIVSNTDAFSNRGSIINLINTGSIKGGNVSGGTGSAIKNGDSSLIGNVTNLTNTGALSSGGTGYGIYSYLDKGSVSNLNNGQGGDSTTPSTTALKHWGPLPTNYNLIVTSAAKYGQLEATSPSGSITFGIYSGGVTGVPASTLASGTYTNVFTGLNELNISGATSGTYGTYNWSLTRIGTNWNLIVTCASSCSNSGSSNSSSGSSSSSAVTNITSNQSVQLSAVGSTANPVLDGGTLLLGSGESSSQRFSVTNNNGWVTSAAKSKSTLSGGFTGPGALTFNGTGKTVLVGTSSYTGGTTVSEGALELQNGSLGSGSVTVETGAELRGSGTIDGPVQVYGLLKPGNSPGYLAMNSSVTMNSGSTFQQDIAGTTQASQLTPIGATGYYSFMNIINGQFIINSGSILKPTLQNLFSTDESGYGSIPYTPKLGDQFRIVTAAGGISGRFSSLVQPDGLALGTQFVSFYNMNSSNSLDLAVVPYSYKTTISSASGNRNAQSVGSVLDQITQANTSGTSTSIQDKLLYSISNQTSGSGIALYAQSLAGEVYAAAVATIAQISQRVQQAVLTRLGDTMGLGLPNSLTNPAGNTALMNTTNTALNGGVASSAVSTNPNVNPASESFSNGNVWGELAYQKGNRASDSYSGGWNSNLYQLVFGSDFIKANGLNVGGGFALSSTTLNPTYGSGTIQQGSLFAYGKIPVKEYVVDAMASFGFNSSNLSRGDITELSNGFNNKSISGQDAMISLGVSRPVDIDHFRITPYARVTWQVVMQSGVKEGSAASALSVNNFTGNGVRGVIGIAAGSKASFPMTNPYTYRAYVGVGADSPGVLNPTLNASIAGINTNITTPNAGATFVQAGLYGTAQISNNAYAYLGLSGEARSGQTLGAVNLGVRVQF